MDIIIRVAGGHVSVGEVRQGQIHHAPFAAMNAERLTLRQLIQKLWGHPNTLVVEDCEFGTGYHSVSTACGAGGASWTYRLHNILAEDEAIRQHDKQVAAANAGVPVTDPSGLEVAFERARMK